MDLAEKKEITRIPKATFERFKQYHALLKQLIFEKKYEFLLSDDIANMLGIKPEQVRKDFTYLKTSGRPKIGYSVYELMEELEELFGIKETENIIIIGAGHLGKAIANYKAFGNIGAKVVAIFDKDPAKVGTMTKDLMILPMKDIARVIKRFNVKIAAICVPDNAAQEVANILVKEGIKAIWNFSSRILDLPKDVIIQNEDITRGLLGIKHKISEKGQKS